MNTYIIGIPIYIFFNILTMKLAQKDLCVLGVFMKQFFFFVSVCLAQTQRGYFLHSPIFFLYRMSHKITMQVHSKYWH